MDEAEPNPTQHWFYIDLVEEIFEGPFTLDDLKQKLIDGKVFWSDIALCPAKDFSWVRLFEIQELVELCPKLPPPEVLKHFRNVAFKQSTFVHLPLQLPPGQAIAHDPEPVPSPAPKKAPAEPAAPAAKAPTPAPAPAPKPTITVKPSPSAAVPYAPPPALKPLAREIPIPEPESASTRAKQQTRIKTIVEARAKAAPEEDPWASPAPKKPVVQARVSAPAPAPTRPRVSTQGPAEWHLLIDDNEGGPFTLREIETAFKMGRKPDRAYVWKAGMKRWRPIGAVPEFKHLQAGAYGSDFVEEEKEDEPELEMNQNMRQAFRKSFVAAVLRIAENGVRQMIGVCGNITTEGLHLHQDTLRVQYPLKSRHTLEIRPLKLTKLPPFRVLAEVRWMDPDTHGIGFQFMEIGPNEQMLLQRYLKSIK